MSEPMLPHVLNVLIAGRTTAATPEAIKAACASAGMIVHSDLNPNVDIVFSVDGDDRNGFVRMARELIQSGKPMLIQTLADLNRATADPADYFKRLGKVFVQAFLLPTEDEIAAHHKDGGADEARRAVEMIEAMVAS